MRTWMRRLLVYWLPCLIVAGGLGALGFVETWPIKQLRLAGLDFLQRTWPLELPSGQPTAVVVLDIDEASLARYGQWPWPRVMLADIVTRAQAAGAQVVAMDIAFPEPDRIDPDQLARYLGPLPSEVRERLMALPNGDEAFAAALKQGRTVIGSLGHEHAAISTSKRHLVAFSGPPARQLIPQLPAIVGSLPMLENAATGVGVTTLFPGDGVVRCLPQVFGHAGNFYSRLELEILRVLSGRASIVVRTNQAGIQDVFISPQMNLPTDASGCLWPRYPAHIPIPRISLNRFLEDPAVGAQLKNRIVLLGVTAAGVRNPWLTPLGSEYAVLATAWVVEAILRGQVLNRPNTSNTVEAFLTLIAALLAAVLVGVLRGRWPLVAGIAAAAAAFGVSAWAFLGYGFLFDGFVPALAALGMSAIAPVLWRFSTKPAVNIDAAG